MTQAFEQATAGERIGEIVLALIKAGATHVSIDALDGFVVIADQGVHGSATGRVDLSA